MVRGKFGITLGAVAVIAFTLAFFGFTEVLVLVVGFALIAERSNWLSKQTLQALYLRLSLSIVTIVLGWIFIGISRFFHFIYAYNAEGLMTSIDNVIVGILNILMLVVCIIAVVRVLQDKDANLPLFGSLADKSLGLFRKKATPPPPNYQSGPSYAPPSGQPRPYQPPMPNAAPGQHYAPPSPNPAPAPGPVPNSAPAQDPGIAKQPVVPDRKPAAPEAASAPEEKVGSYEKPKAEAPAAAENQTVPSGWTCATCGRINTGNFCAACGSRRPD